MISDPYDLGSVRRALAKAAPYAFLWHGRSYFLRPLLRRRAERARALRRGGVAARTAACSPGVAIFTRTATG